MADFSWASDDMFIDARFPLGLSTGAIVSLEMQTLITRMDGGFESRQSRWSAPLRQYSIRTARSLAEVETLRRFWTAAGGAFRSFRFKDFSEYTSSSFVGDDAVTPNAISMLDQRIGIGDGGTVAFQFLKRYIVDHEDGGSPIVQTIVTRPITKIVNGTTPLVALDGVQILANDSPGWSLDYTTGIITFDSPPGNGVVITAGFEFDVHVRFNDDMLTSSFVSTYEMETDGIKLVELRPNNA